MEKSPSTIYYKRARFLTHLPVDRLYTKSHYWLASSPAASPGDWRVGVTKFAGRMLGDMVEFGFSVKQGDRIEVGQVIGWMEGFKAVSDLYSAAAGEFVGSNPALDGDITLMDAKPYAEGWLYEVRGEPDPSAVDVNGYIALLDATIDKMLTSRHDGADDA
jgi:glycine cleavage system H protein